MKPLDLHSPIQINQIPKDLPGDSYEVIKQEMDLGNELLFLQNQSGMPDETVIIAAFSQPFFGVYKNINFHFEHGRSDGYEYALVCSNNDGCTIVYAGKIAPNNCLL